MAEASACSSWFALPWSPAMRAEAGAQVVIVSRKADQLVRGTIVLPHGLGGAAVVGEERRHGREDLPVVQGQPLGPALQHREHHRHPRRVDAVDEALRQQLPHKPRAAGANAQADGYFMSAGGRTRQVQTYSESRLEFGSIGRKMFPYALADGTEAAKSNIEGERFGHVFGAAV